jgi:ribosomal protein S6--L-glutamate ligase
MKIAILSRASKCYSTRRLVAAARQRGHQVRVLDTLKFSLGVEHHNPSITYLNEALPEYDAVIPRIGLTISDFGSAVVRQFEQMGIYTLNTARAISVSRDKLRSLQELSRYDIGIPATEFVRRRKDILPAIDKVGGAPVVIKLLQGTQGLGVILADNAKIAEAIIETLQRTNHSVLIQKFVAESKGRDVRALVVGNRVVAAMRRTADGQEFRSNVHRGGKTEALKLDPIYEKTALRATHILGLQVAGVDMLEGKNGPQVMEVNSSPGLEGIEGATQLDIAGMIIKLVEQQVNFPEFDLRERLTLNPTFGVAEIHVSAESELASKTITETGLRGRDVVVLMIERPDAVYANPPGNRKLLAGDHLTLFGDRSVLNTLLPSHKPKRGRKRAKKQDGE